MELLCYNCKARENLHIAPQTIEMRRKWMELIPDAFGTMFDSTFRLCSDHFDSKFFTRDGKLSVHAVPTKFIVHNVWFEVEQEGTEKNLFDRTGLTDSPFNGDLINILSKINSSPDVPTMDFRFASLENTPIKTDITPTLSGALHDNKASVDDYLDNNSLFSTLSNIDLPLTGSPKTTTVSNVSNFNSPPFAATLKNETISPEVVKNKLRSPPAPTRMDNSSVVSPTVPKSNAALLAAPSIRKTELPNSQTKLKSHVMPETKHESPCRIISNEIINLPPLKKVEAVAAPRKLKVCFVKVKRLKLGRLPKTNNDTKSPAPVNSPVISSKDELQKYQRDLQMANKLHRTLLRQLNRSRTKASKLRTFLEELNSSGMILKKEKPNEIKL